MNRREVPTLIVAGGKDVTVGPAAAAAMRKAAPRAHFVELPNACHAGMIGERDAIAAALDAFFAAKDEAVEFHRARLRDVHGDCIPAGFAARTRARVASVSVTTR